MNDKELEAKAKAKAKEISDRHQFSEFDQTAIVRGEVGKLETEIIPGFKTFDDAVRWAQNPYNYNSGKQIDAGLALQVANVAVTKLWTQGVISERQCLQINDVIREAINKYTP